MSTETTKKFYMVGTTLLPKVTEDDDGKVLAVYKGKWVAKKVNVDEDTSPKVTYEEIKQ